MTLSLYEICDATNNNEIMFETKFVLNPLKWKLLDRDIETYLQNPVRLKFDGNIRNVLNGIKDAKGIYFFCLESDFHNTLYSNYLLYVGRVTAGNTFFKRFYEYVVAIGNTEQRRNILKLTNLWPDLTYVYFFAMEVPDEQIKYIENNLISALIPPLNSQITGTTGGTTELYKDENL